MPDEAINHDQLFYGKRTIRFSVPIGTLLNSDIFPTEYELTKFEEMAIAYVLSPEFLAKKEGGVSKTLREDKKAVEYKALCLSADKFPPELVQSHNDCLNYFFEEVEMSKQAVRCLCFPVDMFPPELIFHNRDRLTTIIRAEIPTNQ